MQIRPDLLTLNQLLNERLFVIPDYQRAYSWDKKQRDDLFSDIAKVMASGEGHFMATVVALRRKVRTILTNEFFEVDVVDGQQRLTTLVLLLKAIERALDPGSDLEGPVARELRGLLVKQDSVAPVLLQTNHDSSQYCLSFLRDGIHPEPQAALTLADRKLLDAIVECKRFVAEWKEKGKLVDLVACLKNKLTFIFHELDNEASVYTVFEVLNSRGLDVSWLDRLKSILMGLAFEAKTGNENQTIGELHRIWRDIYGQIGLRQGMSPEALRFAAALVRKEQPSRTPSEEDAVAILREHSEGTPKGVIRVSEWLLQVTRAVDSLFSDQSRSGAGEIAQARLLATAIALRSDLPPAARDALMDHWERVSFRIFGLCRKDARTKVGDYVRLAWRVVNENLAPEQISGAIREMGQEHPIDKAISELQGTDCYNDWQSELRYLLFCYEQHLSAEAGQNFDNAQWARIWEATAAESIEHILPQSKGAIKPGGPGIFVHRLGNLMLLPPRLNSRLQARKPSDKADEYRSTGLRQAVAVASSLDRWDLEAVDARESELLSWIAQRWAD